MLSELTRETKAPSPIIIENATVALCVITVGREGPRTLSCADEQCVVLAVVMGRGARSRCIEGPLGVLNHVGLTSIEWCWRSSGGRSCTNMK